MGPSVTYYSLSVSTDSDVFYLTSRICYDDAISIVFSTCCGVWTWTVSCFFVVWTWTVSCFVVFSTCYGASTCSACVLLRPFSLVYVAIPILWAFFKVNIFFYFGKYYMRSGRHWFFFDQYLHSRFLLHPSLPPLPAWLHFLILSSCSFLIFLRRE